MAEVGGTAVEAQPTLIKETEHEIESNRQMVSSEKRKLEAVETDNEHNLYIQTKKRKWWTLLPYITPEGANNLKNHKYSGTDMGIAYVYCYSPIANRLVEFLPKTIAPNSITLVGFLHTIIPFVILVGLTKGSLISAVPRWFCFLQAYCYFGYRMLDEMDGKQARRT